jgi:CheY-like chemotaxis protein
MLVVDDSDINLEVARRIFEGEGARVSQAENGQEALNWLSANEGAVDLVLMDVQMPVMNGYEATKQIRRIEAWKELPVVALTAGAFVEHQAQAKIAGMSGFISKPFDVEKAIALILQLTAHISVARAVQVAETQQKPHGGSSDMPGLAITKALKIWRDSAKYQTFLRKFASQYKDVVLDLREANAVDGKAIAHKFRGAAANLGMDEVANVALLVEQILKQGDAPHQSLQDLQQAMETALESIARYALPDSQEKSALHVNHSEFVEWLPRLLEAWHSDSSSSVERVMAEKGNALPAKSRELLQTALLNYDFRGGEAETTALMQSLQAGKGSS